MAGRQADKENVSAKTEAEYADLEEQMEGMKLSADMKKVLREKFADQVCMRCARRQRCV